MFAHYLQIILNILYVCQLLGFLTLYRNDVTFELINEIFYIFVCLPVSYISSKFFISGGQLLRTLVLFCDKPVEIDLKF